MSGAEPTPIPDQAAKAKAAKRRGVVIVAVLVVIVLLLLAGYQYADMATAEYKESENAHRLVQARAFAMSGVDFAAGLLGRPENLANLNGSPWNNALFKDVEIKDENGTAIGRFSITAPPDPTDVGVTDPLYGVTCEAGKLK